MWRKHWGHREERWLPFREHEMEGYKLIAGWNSGDAVACRGIFLIEAVLQRRRARVPQTKRYRKFFRHLSNESDITFLDTKALHHDP